MSSIQAALIFRLPRDVIIHHILQYVAPIDLVILSITAVKFRSLVVTSRGPWHQTFDSIFRNGYLDTLRWCQQFLKYPKNDSLVFRRRLILAAEGTSCSRVKLRCSQDLLGGHTALLKYSYENMPRTFFEYDQHRLTQAAAEYGHLHLLEWLLERDIPQSSFSLCVYTGAVVGGQIEVLEWAEAKRLSPTLLHKTNSHRVSTYTTLKAAEGGKLAALQWLVANGHPWTPDIIMPAIRSGNVALVKWLLVDLNCPAQNPGILIIQAASSGRIPLLSYLHEERGCEFTEVLCTEAARYGHVDALKWLVAKGCPMNERECETVARWNLNQSVLQWLAEKQKERAQQNSK